MEVYICGLDFILRFKFLAGKEGGARFILFAPKTSNLPESKLARNDMNLKTGIDAILFICCVPMLLWSYEGSIKGRERGSEEGRGTE